MNFAELPNQIKVMLGALVLVALLAVGANFIPRGGGGQASADGTAVAPGQVMIYSNMEPKVAAEAAAELKEKGIPFSIVRDGTAISVPSDKADEARIKLALKGLPKEGDIGFSQLFGDKPNSFISTDFEKKVAYNRALMGELGRVIKKIDGVETAAVIINTPEEQLFAEEKKPVTASVMVKQMPNRVLSKDQVEGIQHLIASSVPGLKTNNVTVVSDTGKLMSDGMADNAGDIEDQLLTKALDRQMMLTRERENAVEAKVQSLLDKLFGPGKAVVRVAVELDFTQKKTMTDLYNAPTDGQGNRVATSKERVEERGGSNGSNAGGVPGVASNVPNYPISGGMDGGSNNQYSRVREQETTTNLSRQRQLTEEEVGTLKRMSITALIQGLPAERVVSMTEIVTAAAGADVLRRGDQVVVRPVAFDSSQTDMLKELIAQETAAKDPANLAKKKTEGPVNLPLIIGVAAAVVVILGFLLIMRMASRKEDTTDVLVNSLGDPGLPANFDPNALGYQNQYEMTGQVPMAGNDGPFGFLEQTEPELVADLLSQERPGTAAAVLSQLNPDYANMVLSVMPEDLQVDLLNRLDDNQPALPPFQQKTIAQQLKRRLGVPV